MAPLRMMLLATLLSGAWGASYAHTEKSGAMKSGAIVKEQKAWGIAGDAKRVTRTVEITMLDTMRFVPDRVEVRQGETLKFVVRNDGKILHEMVIGNKQSLAEHAAQMIEFPGMEHDEPYSVHVGAGKSGSIVWNFNRVGAFDFGCLIAGHFQAGMVGTIQVSAAKGK